MAFSRRRASASQASAVSSLRGCVRPSRRVDDDPGDLDRLAPDAVGGDGGAGGHPAAGGRRQPQLHHVAAHQLQLLVDDAEPGRLLHVAARCLEQHRRLAQLLLGLDPAPVGLAIGGERRAIERGEHARRLQRLGDAPPLGGRGRVQVRRAGRQSLGPMPRGARDLAAAGKSPDHSRAGATGSATASITLSGFAS